jgi:hypothetical protein
MSEQEFSTLQETMSNFSHFFQQQWTRSTGKERVNHLLKRMTDLKPLLVIDEKTTEKPVEIKEEAIQEDETQETQSSHEFYETPEMMNLIKKLKTFEKLSEKGEFLKAALVSNDISQILAQFDPCFYFPKLFSTYFNLLARHSSSIAELSQNQESLEWKALEKLYKIDLDQFTQW